MMEVELVNYGPVTLWLDTVDRLRETQMLDCLELVHFHIGSQISAVRAIKDAMKEACRVFVELAKSGAALKYIDVGGGLGVDYDGSSTNWQSSTNYTMQEYANDVVAAVQEACDRSGVPHPDIVSESGRAMVAHHSVLVFNVLDVNEVVGGHAPPQVGPDEHPVIQSLAETWRSVSRKNFQEAYHDALQFKEEATGLFITTQVEMPRRRGDTVPASWARRRAQYNAQTRTVAQRARMERMARFDLAVCHDLAGNRAEALRAYERFVHRFPNDPRVPEAYFRMGVVARAMGRLEDAAQDFTHVWQAESTAAVFRAGSIYQTGLCLEALQRDAEARQTYALAKALEPRADPCRLAALHRLALLVRDVEPLLALEIFRDLAAHSPHAVERALAQQELLDPQSERAVGTRCGVGARLRATDARRPQAASHSKRPPTPSGLPRPPQP